jgi:hypothetical protein
MPIVYRCRECRLELARYFAGRINDKDIAQTPMELNHRLRGRCPGCGRELDFQTRNPEDIQIRGAA